MTMAGLPAQFGGIVPPVCTPLTEDFAVDTDSLQRLIEFQLAAGVHGLFALGSTSETVFLTDRQRATVIETIVKTAAGQVPVFAGVLDTTTALCIEHARVAQRAGVDGIVLTAPFYARVNQAEIIEHFRLVHKAVGLPILAYDIPVAVPTKLDGDTVVQLARAGTIVGFKDSSGDLSGFRDVVMRASSLPGARFVSFTGSERLVDVAMLMGASGSVPGLGNVDPAGYVRLYDAACAGDWAAARREQERQCQLFAIVRAGAATRMSGTAGGIGGIKTALQLRGVIATNVVGRPLTRYNAGEVERVRAILGAVGLL